MSFMAYIVINGSDWAVIDGSDLTYKLAHFSYLFIQQVRIRTLLPKVTDYYTLQNRIVLTPFFMRNRIIFVDSLIAL